MRSWHLDPITSWQKDGETVETVTDFILGGFILRQTLFCTKCSDFTAGHEVAESDMTERLN